MKKIAVTLILLISVAFAHQSKAQKFAYVDTDYILENMPEYRAAQQKLTDIVKDWQKEIESTKSEIEKLYRDYRAERVLLPEAIKKEREEEITKLEKQLSEFKNKKFGPGGEYEKKQSELLKPIQDKVFNAIQEVAKDNALDFILDKAGTITMLYTNAKFDRSDEVLEYLGITPTEQTIEE